MTKVVTTKDMVNDLIDNLKWRPEDFSCIDGMLKDHLTLALYSVGGRFWQVGMIMPVAIPFTFSEGWRLRRSYKAWAKKVEAAIPTGYTGP